MKDCIVNVDCLENFVFWKRQIIMFEKCLIEPLICTIGQYIPKLESARGSNSSSAL